MGLTAAEEAELTSLKKQVSAPQSSSGLTPAEEAELASLKKQVTDPNQMTGQARIDFMRSGQDQSAMGRATLPNDPATKQSILNQLPVVGGIAGGIGGGAAGMLAVPVTGPIGPVAGEYLGAGGGGALGEALKYGGEKYLLGKNMEDENLAKRMAISGGAAMLGQGMGNVISAGAKGFAKSGVNDIAQTLSKPGADQIRAAAGQMGIKPTQGMLTDDYTIRNLEDSLGQSPSVPGQWVRNEQKPVREAINKSIEKAVEGKSLSSDVEAGKSLKKGVSDYFEGRTEPIRKSYEEIESHTKNIPLNEKGLKRIAQNIRNLDEAKFKQFEGHGIANKFADALENATDVNDIKILLSKAKAILREPSEKYEAKSVASQIVDKLEQAQNNSITRQAVQIAREAPVDKTSAGKFLNKAQKGLADEEAVAEGQDIGRKLIGDIKSTNKDYRGLIEDAQKFGKGTGLTKANKGMSATMNDIAKATPEEMSQALFDQNNVEFMHFVKEKMPAQFEQARQQKLAEIVKRTGGDTTQMLKLADKMGRESPEAMAILFGTENIESLANANTLRQAIPGKVGASDTPRGLQFRDILSPTQNIVDFGRYGLLKGKKYAPAFGGMLDKARYPTQGLVTNGLVYDRKD